MKGNHEGTNYEFDIIAVNGDEVVVVEVKTTLRAKHVSKFLEDMKQVKTWLHQYSSKRIYGAVAYLQAQDSADKMAENKGLFVIRATGDSAAILNHPNFKPKGF